MPNFADKALWAWRGLVRVTQVSHSHQGEAWKLGTWGFVCLFVCWPALLSFHNEWILENTRNNLRKSDGGCQSPATTAVILWSQEKVVRPCLLRMKCHKNSKAGLKFPGGGDLFIVSSNNCCGALVNKCVAQNKPRFSLWTRAWLCSHFCILHPFWIIDLWYFCCYSGLLPLQRPPTFVPALFSHPSVNWYLLLLGHRQMCAFFCGSSPCWLCFYISGIKQW